MLFFNIFCVETSHDYKKNHKSNNTGCNKKYPIRRRKISIVRKLDNNQTIYSREATVAFTYRNRITKQITFVTVTNAIITESIRKLFCLQYPRHLPYCMNSHFFTLAYLSREYKSHVFT